MASTKISALTALTGATTADDDEFVIVDTSAGETKRMTGTELKAYLGLTSAVIGTMVDDTTLGSDGSLDLSGLTLSSYDRIELRGELRDATAADITGVFVRFNSDSGANYNSATGAVGDDGVVVNAGADGLATNEGYAWGLIAANHSRTNAFSAVELIIQNPGGTSQEKGYLARSQYDDPDSLTLAYVNQAAGRWQSTSAITAISFHDGTGTAVTFKSGSRLQVIGYTS